MSEITILDACALIALLKREEGSDIVAGVYTKAVEGEGVLMMHKLNLLEVY